jgi:hypothetical protein
MIMMTASKQNTATRMIQGPGYALTFLYYFSITIVLVGLVGTQGLGYGWDDRALYQVAVPFALLVGSIGAYFNQSITLTIPHQSPATCQKQLQDHLQTLGYTETIQVETTTVYSRPGLSKWLSGKVFLQLEPKQAMISGRSGTINRLEKLLRPES